MAKTKSTGNPKSAPSSQTVDPEKLGYFRSYRRIVMYEDLNAAGSIFGGKLVSWIDEGTAIYASCQMNARRVVTKKISELLFNQPARLGDMLEIWCKIAHAGNTSLTIDVVVSRRTFADDPARSPDDKSSGEICRCELVFVAVDEKGRPRPWNVKKG